MKRIEAASGAAPSRRQRRLSHPLSGAVCGQGRLGNLQQIVAKTYISLQALARAIARQQPQPQSHQAFQHQQSPEFSGLPDQNPRRDICDNA
ncbi:MAG: hypothetical protein HC910_18445 [Spirulinaceae cyanobacterium SM2_1_0]|nr:hypothetical protein [Spirulinaceae cyanobacterium SM2_1_0]